MARSRNGEAITEARRTPDEVAKLRDLLHEAEVASDLPMWRRAKAVLGYLEGRSVIALSQEFDVTRQAITSWLPWYNAEGADGLRTRKAPGAPCRLSPEQRERLVAVLEAGPQAAGFQSGVWTGPMVGEYIREHFAVTYHVQHIPRLLHELGFSVQRPRKRLARANHDAQAEWIEKRLPAIKKKPAAAGASSSLRTKPVSGLMARCTEPGRP
jgi:transposase